MTETIIVNGKEQRIEVYVVVTNGENNEVVAEFDNMGDAGKHFGGQYGKRWAAAEWIDEDGNLNPAVYADTKRKAIAKLKSVL